MLYSAQEGYQTTIITSDWCNCLSTGAIVGIVIGCFVFLVIVIVIC